MDREWDVFGHSSCHRHLKLLHAGGFPCIYIPPTISLPAKKPEKHIRTLYCWLNLTISGIEKTRNLSIKTCQKRSQTFSECTWPRYTLFSSFFSTKSVFLAKERVFKSVMELLAAGVKSLRGEFIHILFFFPLFWERSALSQKGLSSGGLRWSKGGDRSLSTQGSFGRPADWLKCPDSSKPNSSKKNISHENGLEKIKILKKYIIYYFEDMLHTSGLGRK